MEMHSSWETATGYEDVDIGVVRDKHMAAVPVYLTTQQ